MNTRHKGVDCSSFHLKAVLMFLCVSEVTRTLPGTTVFLRENKKTMTARLKFKSKISRLA